MSVDLSSSEGGCGEGCDAFGASGFVDNVDLGVDASLACDVPDDCDGVAGDLFDGVALPSGTPTFPFARFLGAIVDISPAARAAI